MKRNNEPFENLSKCGRAPGLRAIMSLALLSLAILMMQATNVTLVGQSIANAAGRVINISGGQRVGKLTVSIGKSETLRVSEAFENVVVGDPETADVAPLTDQTLYVLGRKLGTTNIALYDADKKLIAVIDIEVSINLSGLEFALRKAVPSANIKVTNINGRVLLEGTVPNAVTLDKAVDIAEDFAPKLVTNSLSVGSNQQVMLEVKFLEATRGNSRELGIQWQALANNFAIGTLNFQSPASLLTGVATSLSTGATGSSFGRFLGGGANQLNAIIEALEAKSLVRTLAEPNLVALSGETASFLAGGEFPIPVARDAEDDGRSTVTIVFKKFGVGLAFTPTVLANGLINLVVEPEVSEIAGNVTLTINSFVIPSFNVRRAKTTIELRDGQSFALAGLFSATNRRSLSQVPWIGDVPILGTLFRSSRFDREETDLVIIVTPHLVRPQPPNRPLASPLDDSMSSNDKELFLFGKLEVTKEMAKFIETGGHLKGPFGHIIDLKGGSNRAVLK